jgi:hypothetical protein
LEDVIYYELSVKTNDSILSLVKMSDEERTAYFKITLKNKKRSSIKKKILLTLKTKPT